MKEKRLKKGKLLRNCMWVALALAIVSLTILSTIYMLEQQEKSWMGSLERATGKKVSLFQPESSNLPASQEDSSYQMLVDRLLCLNNVDQERIREPRQHELTMEEAYTRCLEELERMTALGVKITEWELDAFQLDNAQLVSLYSEEYGESAWWWIHLKAQDAESGRYARMEVQLDAMTGIICELNLEQNPPFEREGSLEEIALAYQTYLGIPDKFTGEAEIREGEDGTPSSSFFYTLDGRLAIAMQDFLVDGENRGFFLWVRST